MYELKKNGKVFTSKSVGTGPSSYEKRIYRTAVSQRLRNTGLGGYMKVYLEEGEELLGLTTFPPSRQHPSSPHAIMKFMGEGGEIYIYIYIYIYMHLLSD